MVYLIWHKSARLSPVCKSFFLKMTFVYVKMNLRKAGDGMKKVISWILLIVTVFIFAYDIYVTISGTIAVKKEYERIEAMGGSGVDYFGVGADILALYVIFITFVGMVFSVISAVVSWKCNQSIVWIASVAIFVLIIPTVAACFGFTYRLP